MQEAVDAYARYGEKSKAAMALGIKENTFRSRYTNALAAGIKPGAIEPPAPIPPPPSIAPRQFAEAAAHTSDKPRRHLIIPDVQAKPGMPIDHLDWAGQAIVEYHPDVIVCIGDFFDFASLNSHAQPGSRDLEGLRFKDDVDYGNAAFARLCAPMEAEIKRTAKTKDPWKPLLIVTLGNHEERADRVSATDPKWQGTIGSDHCDFRGWHVYPFLQPVEVDGVLYCHYFKSFNSKFAIGGSPDNRLNRIGRTHTQGHQVGFLYGNRNYPDGSVRHSLTAGSFYLHQESYRGPQCNKHFRGLVVKNQTRNGNYSIMPLDISYLCKKYTGQELVPYMNMKYPGMDWSHLDD